MLWGRGGCHMQDQGVRWGPSTQHSKPAFPVSFLEGDCVSPAWEEIHLLLPSKLTQEDAAHWFEE